MAINALLPAKIQHWHTILTHLKVNPYLGERLRDLETDCCVQWLIVSSLSFKSPDLDILSWSLHSGSAMSGASSSQLMESLLSWATKVLRLLTVVSVKIIQKNRRHSTLELSQDCDDGEAVNHHLWAALGWENSQKLKIYLWTKHDDFSKITKLDSNSTTFLWFSCHTWLLTSWAD